MATLNRVTLIGNLTRDPQLRHTQGGKAVCEVALAINEKQKRDGRWIDAEPVYVDVVCWERTAEVAAEYLSKGSPVLIEGRLKLETWETDGQNRSKLKVTCSNLQLLGKKPANGHATGNGETAQPVAATTGDDSPY